MLKKYIVIGALISSYVGQTRPMSLFCRGLKNNPTFPLFGKPVLSSATTTRLISKILESRRTIFYGSCAVGGLCLGLAVADLSNRHPILRPEHVAALTVLGITIPLCTYSLLHLVCMPTIGTLTMLAGE